MKSTDRIEIAATTLAIIKQGFYRNGLGEVVSIEDATNEAVKNTKLFRPEDFPADLALVKNTAEVAFEVTDETTLEAAKRICREVESSNPFVLNFASAKNPGGGFLSGSQAQEESLARSSSLYPCLMANHEMYDFNRKGKSCLYSDWMIYSPEVPVFRNDDGSLTDQPYLVTIMTSPAVNAGVVRQREPAAVESIDKVNRERARKFLWVANRFGHGTLILGAWGCGVFQNDPVEIAQTFYDLLKNEFAGCFERIVMAIYDMTPTRKVYTPFRARFS